MSLEQAALHSLIAPCLVSKDETQVEERREEKTLLRVQANVPGFPKGPTLRSLVTGVGQGRPSPSLSLLPTCQAAPHPGQNA